MASDEPTSPSSVPSPPVARPWASIARGCAVGVGIGALGWLGWPLAVVAVGVAGGWVGWRRWEAERAIARLQAAAALRERELLGKAWYARTVLQSAFDAVMVVGSDNRVMDANPSVEQLFGVPHDVLNGAPLVELLPDLASAQDTPDGTVRMLGTHADGSQFEVDVQAVPLRSAGSPDLPWGRARIVAVREVPRVATRAQVLREAAELQRSRFVVEQRKRGQVLGLIGDGLREQLHQLHALTKSPRIGHQPLREVGDALQDQLELLWTLAMWERSGADPTLAPVDFGALVREVSAEVAPLARRRGSSLAVRVGDDLDEVVTDATVLRCAVRTVLLQALRTTREATVRVEAVRESGRDADWATLVVDDDQHRPLSIEAREAIQAAFDASEDASPPLDGRATVALARRLARSMGGHVMVGTHPTLGTTLTLRVPVNTARNRTPRSDRRGRRTAAPA
ncbi:MAG: PAS domain-containing protein [Myxococcota bacterium]